MSLREASIALALAACAVVPRQEDPMTGAIATVEHFSGIGPQADLEGGVTVALRADEWRRFEARLPEGHPARGRCADVDFSRSAVVFVRYPADSNTRLHVASAAVSQGELALQLSRKAEVPDLLAVVPAQAWLLLEVPRASVAARPALSVWVAGALFDARVEYLG